MLDFRIETFLTVCETMNFTRASELLNMTQPAVSQHIHYLEDRYGVKLFSYSKKKLSLTRAGELLRNAAGTMQRDDGYLAEKLINAENVVQPLHFGATLTIAEFALPEALCRYIKTNPHKKVQVVSANTQELLSELDRGELDFVLAEGYFPRDTYEHMLFSREQFVAVCSKDYPLPMEPCRLEELLGERLLLREPGSGTREILEKHLEARGLSTEDFRNPVVLGNLGGIIQLAVMGCGIAFLYRRGAERELKAGHLREINIKNLNITHDFNFLWRKNSIFGREYESICRELVG